MFSTENEMVYSLRSWSCVIVWKRLYLNAKPTPTAITKSIITASRIPKRGNLRVFSVVDFFCFLSVTAHQTYQFSLNRNTFGTVYSGFIIFIAGL